MTQDNVHIKDVNRLAIPAMLAGIAEPLIGIADTAIVGNMPENSTDALAGMGIAVGFFLFMFWVFVQLETALSSLVAQAVGNKTVHKLQSLFSQNMLLNVVIGVGLYFGTNACLSWIFDLYNAEGLQKAFAVEYYEIRSIGFPILLALWGVWGAFRGLQNTSWAMWIMLGGGAINLLLDFLLVYGVRDIIPAMGVAGAAWASLAAQVFMLLISVIILFRKTPFRFKAWWPIHDQFVKLLGMGGSFVIRTLALSTVLQMAMAYATDISPAAMAAHSIAYQLWLLSAFFLDGYANAGLALSGKLLGEKRWGALSDLTGRLIKIGFVVAGIIMLVYGATYPWIGGWFSNDPEVVLQFGTIFWIVIITQPLNSIAFTLDGALKGLGMATFLMVLMVVALVVFAIYLNVIDAFDLGLPWLWGGIVIWMIVRALWGSLHLRRKLRLAVEKSMEK